MYASLIERAHSTPTFFPMSPQINLLAQVRQYLISRNEDFEWITMGAEKQRIGLAYLPYIESDMPCTFMFTELEEPRTLVFDAHFALRVAQEDLQEISLLLTTINANIPEGHLLLDVDGGFVYYRLKYCPNIEELTKEQLEAQITHMEELGVNMSLTYARIIAEEFETI